MPQKAMLDATAVGIVMLDGEKTRESGGKPSPRTVSKPEGAFNCTCAAAGGGEPEPLKPRAPTTLAERKRMSGVAEGEGAVEEEGESVKDAVQEDELVVDDVNVVVSDGVALTVEDSFEEGVTDNEPRVDSVDEGVTDMVAEYEAEGASLRVRNGVDDQLLVTDADVVGMGEAFVVAVIVVDDKDVGDGLGVCAFEREAVGETVRPVENDDDADADVVGLGLGDQLGLPVCVGVVVRVAAATVKLTVAETEANTLAEGDIVGVVDGERGRND